MDSMPPATMISASASLDGLGGKRDGAETRAADLIHGESTCFGWDAGVDGGLACGVLAEAGLEDAAHDALRYFELECCDFREVCCRP